MSCEAVISGGLPLQRRHSRPDVLVENVQYERDHARSTSNVKAAQATDPGSPMQRNTEDREVDSNHSHHTLLHTELDASGGNFVREFESFNPYRQHRALGSSAEGISHAAYPRTDGTNRYVSEEESCELGQFFDESMAAFPEYIGIFGLAMPNDPFVAACYDWSREPIQAEPLQSIDIQDHGPVS